MNHLLYNCLSTHTPLWAKHSEIDAQPHLLRITGQLVNLEHAMVYQSFDFIIRPNGWEVSPECEDNNGVLFDNAKEFGVDEAIALSTFLQVALSKKVKILSSNKMFNSRMIRIGIKRYSDSFGDDVVKAWTLKSTENFDCSNKFTRDLMKKYGGNPNRVIPLDAQLEYHLHQPPDFVSPNYSNQQPERLNDLRRIAESMYSFPWKKTLEGKVPF